MTTGGGGPVSATPSADTGLPPSTRPAVPGWALRVVTVGGAVLVLAASGWLVLSIALRVPLLTMTLAVALLLTALVEPLAAWLRRRGLPPGLAALLSVLLLIATLTGAGFLIGFRAAGKLRDLARPLAAGIDRIRVWLTDGPLDLDPQQVTDARNAVVTRIFEWAPDPAAAARMALHLVAAMVLVCFLVFFLLKDGAGMWSWLVVRAPDRRRGQVDGAGRCAWLVLSKYVRGIVLVALIDAVGIGAALLLLGVPLWVSLTLLTFIGAFIPIFGATVSGVVAVLVTLVTNGLPDAAIVLVVVLAVQQLEGNVLHPVIVGRTLHLHPAVILVTVTAGLLLWGLAGALLAVPLMAVTYRVGDHLRQHPVAPAVPSDGSVPVAPLGPGDGAVRTTVRTPGPA